MQISSVIDERERKTRAAIQGAFFDLVLSKRYDEITTGEIIKKSKVARSTFYKHYANKDAVLATSLEWHFAKFASCIDGRTQAINLESTLEHFWQNRSFARLILTGTPKKSVVGSLSSLLVEELEALQSVSGSSLLISNQQAALQLSESQLALLTSWLLGDATCSVQTLAAAIFNTSNAIVAGLEIG